MKLDRWLGLGLTTFVLLNILHPRAALADDYPHTAPSISITTAIQSVLETHPNVYAVMAKLETEDGILVYEVELSDETYVHVNAQTGELLASE